MARPRRLHFERPDLLESFSVCGLDWRQRGDLTARPAEVTCLACRLRWRRYLPGRLPASRSMTDDPQPEFVSIDHVCERYQLDRRGVRRMIDRGEFPPGLRLSPRRWLFRRDQVEAWERKRWVGEGDLSARAAAAGSGVRRDENGGAKS